MKRDAGGFVCPVHGLVSSDAERGLSDCGGTARQRAEKNPIALPGVNVVTSSPGEGRAAGSLTWQRDGVSQQKAPPVNKQAGSLPTPNSKVCTAANGPGEGRTKN